MRHPINIPNVNLDIHDLALRFQYEVMAFHIRRTKSLILDLLRRPLYNNLSFIQQKYIDNSILSTPNVNIVESYHINYISSRVIACVTS